jgi:hypothetical protein
LERQHNRALYIFFYVLFSAETWRILMGAAMAVLLGPGLTAAGGYGVAAQCVIWVMILAVGYIVSSYPARLISKGLRRLFTGNRT